MQRRVEVNVYSVRRGPRLNNPRFVTLCESCRETLVGSVSVVQFGAESTEFSLTCDECGYEMIVDDSNEAANPSYFTTQEDLDFRQTRVMQRDRLRRRHKTNR